MAAAEPQVGGAGIAYPVARRGDTVENLHGISVPDPFRYLEEPGEEADVWVEGQGKVYGEYIGGQSAVRDSVRERCDEVFNYAKMGSPRKHGDKWYVYHNSGLQNQYVLYQLHECDNDVSKGEAFLDLNEEFPDGKVSLRSSSFSPDGKYFAYALSVSGSDWSTIKVRDTETKEDLPDRVRWVKFSGISWKADSSGFTYQCYSAPGGVAPPNVEVGGGEEEHAADAASAGTETAVVKGHMVRFHTLAGSEDPLVYRHEEDADNTLGAGFTSDGRYLLLYVSSGCDPVNKLYYVDFQHHPTAWSELLESGSTLPIVKLVDTFEAEFSNIANDGNKFWFRTNLHAPRYKLVFAELPEGDEAEAAVTGAVGEEEGAWQVSDWVSEDSEGGVLDSASVLNSAWLFTVITRHAADVLYVQPLYTPQAAATEIELPGPGSVGISGKRSQEQVFIKYVSYLYPGQSYCVTTGVPDTPWTRDAPYSGEGLSAAGGGPEAVQGLDLGLSKEVWASTTVQGFDAEEFQAVQHFATSKDGTKIPYTVVQAKASTGTPVPTLVYGYGGFNISLGPYFSATRLIWLKELGGAWVLANLRGGGEYGEEWHQGGALMNKQNCFDDLAAIGEALVDSGVTTKAQLGIQGGSNGGLLTLVAANQRPDLYKAAVSQVPVADMTRFHKFTIGHAWTTDFGCADDSKDWAEYLLSYSPLHNVKCPTDVSMPSILICTADHDDRVVPGPHSYKMAATLQAIAGPSPIQTNPLLIRIERNAGHGAGKSTSQALDEVADTFAFLARELEATWTPSTSGSAVAE